MTFAGFMDLVAAARARADDGDAEAALDLLQGQEHALSLHAGNIYVLRAALLAGLDRSEAALDVLDDALAAGCRYKAEWLRDDRRLARLQGSARFAAIVERAAARHHDDQAASGPSLEVVTPTTARPESGYPTLIALHGNNSNAKRTLPYWRSAADEGWLVAIPGSSEIGASPDAFTWNDRERTIAELEAHRRALSERALIDERSVALAGFSMGGLQALALSLTRRFAVSGVLAVGAYLPHIREFSPLIAAGNAAGVRFYIVVGAKDTSGYDGAKQLAMELERARVDVVFDERPALSHAYPPDMDATLRRALGFLRSTKQVAPR